MKFHVYPPQWKQTCLFFVRAYKFVCVGVCVRGDKSLSAEDGVFPCRICDAHCGFEAVGWQGWDSCLT